MKERERAKARARERERKREKDSGESGRVRKGSGGSILSVFPRALPRVSYDTTKL